MAGTCAALIAGLGLVQPALAAENLCRPNEFIHFSCRTASRIVSLCGYKETGKDVEYMQYRYGSVARQELTYPFQQWSVGTFTADFASFTKGGYESTVEFEVDHYRYVVYSSLQLGSLEDMNKAKPGTYGPKAGVRVFRGAELVREIACRSEDVASNDPTVFNERLPATVRRKR